MSAREKAMSLGQALDALQEALASAELEGRNRQYLDVRVALGKARRRGERAQEAARELARAGRLAAVGAGITGGAAGALIMMLVCLGQPG